MKVVAAYSIKGGVGKTTAAVNLAYEAAGSGARVLLWDLDPQGAATFFFRVKPRLRGGVDGLVARRSALAGHVKESDVTGLHVVPSDFSLRHLDVALGQRDVPSRLSELLAPIDRAYDVAILDCAPGITLGSEAVFCAADVLLVPTNPTTLSIRTLGQLTEFLADVDGRPLVLPFVSMLDPRQPAHRKLIESLRHVEPQFSAVAIGSSSAVERTAVQRAPLGEVAPHSAARHAFRDLWSQLAAVLWPE